MGISEGKKKARWRNGRGGHGLSGWFYCCLIWHRRMLMLFLCTHSFCLSRLILAES